LAIYFKVFKLILQEKFYKNYVKYRSLGIAGLEGLILSCGMILLAVWPLAGTIAARNIALIIGCFASILWIYIVRIRLSRPSIILGAGDWNKGSTAIFKNVFNEFKWYTTGINGFVDVRDVAKSMLLLMQSDISNEKFIISAENRTYQDVFNCIAENFKKNKPSKLVTPFIASMVWRIEKIKCFFTKKEPLITKETANAALDHVRYDNSKLLKFLPEFTYHKIEDTIFHCCKILQQKINNQ